MLQKGKGKRIRTQRWKPLITLTIVIFVVVFLYQLHLSTGVFQPGALDERDRVHWAYDKEGRIQGASPYKLVGKNETCWLLMHSYGATPAEMHELADTLYAYFGDTIAAPLLRGHGTLPSALEGESLESWYTQVEAELLTGKELCKEVNVVGSSIGGALALRLAEEYNVKNAYVINPFLTKTFVWYKVLPFEWRLRLFSPLLNYDKKTSVANINNPEGKAKHISYWNLPYTPVRESLPFLKTTRKNLPRITEPVFITHSHEDEVAAPTGAQQIFESVSSAEKELLWVERSNHVLLFDFDSDEVIAEIILFEESHR